MKRHRYKTYEELTVEDMQQIERMLNAGIVVKKVLEKININQKTLNFIFEKGFLSLYLEKKKQQPSINLKQKQ